MTVILSQPPAARLVISDKKHTTTVSIPASPSIVIAAKGPQGPPGLGDGPIIELDNVVDEDVTLENNKNALSVGPLAINAGWSVTVPSGAVWVVL